MQLSLVPDILFLLGSYLLGAVPFGLLFARLMSNVDVRSIGSGNIGATNVLRAAGPKAAVLTLIADCIKGVIPVLLASRVSSTDSLPALAGVAALLGHNFPVYLGFKGGKGVATGFGVMLGIFPLAGAGCLLAWLAAAGIWRYSSLAALVSFTFFPLFSFLFRSDDRLTGALSLFLFGMIYFRHRENIKRLIAGTESRIGQKK